MPLSDEDQFSLDSVMQLDIVNINKTAAKVQFIFLQKFQIRIVTI